MAERIKSATIYYNGEPIATTSVSVFNNERAKAIEPLASTFTCSGEISMSRGDWRSFRKSLRGRLRDRRRRCREKNLNVHHRGVLIGKVSGGELLKMSKRSLGAHDRWMREVV